jgi:23S rRNA (pseudouridine1915-N3)-methyltransferase
MSPTIHIVGISKKTTEFTDAIERYVKLMRPYAGVQIVTLKPPVDAEVGVMLAREAEAIRARLPRRSWTVALAPDGRQLDSPEFASWLGGRLDGGAELSFVIGGAYGLDPTLRGECRAAVSLSPLTFTHQLCLLVLVEQLYRAFTILKNHPYHK